MVEAGADTAPKNAGSCLSAALIWLTSNGGDVAPDKPVITLAVRSAFTYNQQFRLTSRRNALPDHNRPLQQPAPTCQTVPEIGRAGR